MSQLRYIGVGGTGLMMSPQAEHLGINGPARYIRIHDRGTQDERRKDARAAWLRHGAELVPDYGALVGDGNFDAVVICAGKNGDDAVILGELLKRMKPQCLDHQPSVLHLSTVSAQFAAVAHEVFDEWRFPYVNWPLTGGPRGAQAGPGKPGDPAKLLILASGDRAVYERNEAFLRAVGVPIPTELFSERVAAGAETKLIGQVMVFSGLLGICGAAALQAECFHDGKFDAAQVKFFDFLNGGAGGTNQWNVALKQGLQSEVWDRGFMTHHASVDAIYAASLAVQRKVSEILVVQPMLTTAVALGYLLRRYPQRLATHAIAREILRANARDFDAYARSTGYLQALSNGQPANALTAAVNALPEDVQRTVELEITPESFEG